MRFLDYPCLQYAQSMLSGIENPISRFFTGIVRDFFFLRIHVQLECFSCKNTSDEKKLHREIDNHIVEEETEFETPFGFFLISFSFMIFF
jgi:hypothetical protein